MQLCSFVQGCYRTAMGADSSDGVQYLTSSNTAQTLRRSTLMVLGQSWPTYHGTRNSSRLQPAHGRAQATCISDANAALDSARRAEASCLQPYTALLAAAGVSSNKQAQQPNHTGNACSMLSVSVAYQQGAQDQRWPLCGQDVSGRHSLVRSAGKCGRACAARRL